MAYNPTQLKPHQRWRLQFTAPHEAKYSFDFTLIQYLEDTGSWVILDCSDPSYHVAYKTWWILDKGAGYHMILLCGNVEHDAAEEV